MEWIHLMLLPLLRSRSGRYVTMLKVVYEDNDILVADKPGGMTVHPSKLHQGDTLADEVRKYLGGEDEFVFRCLTRLDKDTSGLVLIAKTLGAAQRLNEDMAAGNIHREYEAIVEDGPESQDGSAISDEGIIDAPIARASADERDIRRCVNHENGERAVTHYKVIERGEGYAKVRCTLETGRTHQIRVHMRYIGHPIKGDKLYNPQSESDGDGQAMGLRAVELTFPHPITRLEMCVV